jgi:hypothetical protein
VSATSAIQTQARVSFIGACDIGPVFENLWSIRNLRMGCNNQSDDEQTSDCFSSGEGGKSIVASAEGGYSR